MGKSTNKLKEEYWRNIIQECNQATKDGLMTKTEWFEIHNINPATFYRWQQYLRDEFATEVLIQRSQTSVQNEIVISNPVKEVEFVEIQPVDNKQTASTTGATLKFNHVDIELNEDISEELLSKIFKVIRNVE